MGRIEFIGKPMLLVDAQGETVREGQTLTDFRGESAVFVRAWVPGTSQGGSGGRVEVLEDGRRTLYFPSVFDLRWYS